METKEAEGRSPQESWSLLIQSPDFKDEELQSRKTKQINYISPNKLETKPGSAFRFSDSLSNVLNSVFSLGTRCSCFLSVHPWTRAGKSEISETLERSVRGDLVSNFIISQKKIP